MNGQVTQRERIHAEMVRKLAPECIVLLENDGTLPLKDVKKVALYGNGARGTIKGGGGSGDVNARRTYTIEDGLEEEGVQVTTKNWMDRQEIIVKEERAAFLESVKEPAEKEGISWFMYAGFHPLIPNAMADITEEDVAQSDTDTAVFVIARNSREGADRKNAKGDYELSDLEIQNLRLVAQRYEKCIVLLNVGSVIDTKALRAIPGIDAVVNVGQLGASGGLAIADFLIGKTYPSGKLPDTWAENYSDYPSSAHFSNNDGDDIDEYYTEGIYTGYRYFDSFGIKPAYPFGYGKSYTDFKVDVTDAALSGDMVTVTVNVKNIGHLYPGKEVIQVYYSAPAGAIDKPYQSLAGFCKTKELRPGEEEMLTVLFKVSDMASYNMQKAAWILEKGQYPIRVGTDSRHTKIVAKVQLEKEIVVAQLKNLFHDPDPVAPDLKSDTSRYISYESEQTELDQAKILVFDAASIHTQVVSYEESRIELIDNHPDVVITADNVLAGKYTAEELVAQLSIEDMAHLCVGASAVKASDGNFIGHGSQTLVGAAGETTKRLQKSRNIRPMQLADGPAGLRVEPEYLSYPDGTIKTGRGPHFQRVALVDDENSTHHYQYCTAIPIATSLASSWNMELIETCGDVVGTEMEEFGATLWLAPGMNIHRNPLCGRNFEYYSEDPVLTGLCAAHDTLGVQKHYGIGTTIKHFAGNNHEDDRTVSNSHISERALREIYLKGFEIAVKKARPMALMTSYNCLNGTHSANHYDLVTNVLRHEWGFEGMVMSDWLTTIIDNPGLEKHLYPLKYERSLPTLCMHVGNDLIMPGEPHDIEEIIAGVQDGTLHKADLQACAVRIMKTILKSHLYAEGARI